MKRTSLGLILLSVSAFAVAAQTESTIPRGLPPLDAPLMFTPAPSLETEDDLSDAPVPPPSETGTGDRAYAAYQTGYYYTAYMEALKRIEANPGDAPALTLLGELHAQGLGVPRNASEAVSWYQLASERGDPHAMVALAMMKIEGEGTPRDQAGAVELLREAAAGNHPQAHYNLALMALSGNGLPLDPAEAREHFRAAAEAGEPESQYALAALLKEGRGGPVQPAEAVRWLAAAAAQEHTAAEIEYAIALFNGNHIEADEAEAARLLRNAARKGNPIAQNRLARLYAAGRGVEPDSARAMAWHMLARAEGRHDAWLDSFVAGLSEETRQAASDLLRLWSHGEALALDGGRPTGQVTGQPDTNNTVSEP